MIPWLASSSVFVVMFHFFAYIFSKLIQIIVLGSSVSKLCPSVFPSSLCFWVSQCPTKKPVQSWLGQVPWQIKEFVASNDNQCWVYWTYWRKLILITIVPKTNKCDTKFKKKDQFRKKVMFCIIFFVCLCFTLPLKPSLS